MRSVLSLVAFVCVLLLTAACDRAESPTEPSPTGAVTYAALGASDTIGVGGSVVCVPFDPDCPNGSSYVYRVKRRWQNDGATIELANRGFPGHMLSPHFVALSRDLGRDDVLGSLLDQQAAFIPTSSTHVSIFAGGNDANVIAQAVRAGRAGSDIRGYVDQQVQQFGADLSQLISRIRARAPNARIAAFNLPNLAAAAYVSGLSGTERGILQRIAVGITDRINALAGQNVIVVDLMCESRIYSAANYSADGFHPSDPGYALMADLLYPALRNGTAPAPSGSCPQRTLAPVF